VTISRIWHGYTTPDRADDYEALLKAEVIKGIEAKNVPGFRKIDLLRRAVGDEVEFISIMEFDSLDSVKAFAGDDYEQAYVPAEARAILSRFEERSQHYEMRDSRSYHIEQVGDRVLSVANTTGQAPLLPEGAWFVRKDRGNGSVPVTQEGFSVIRKFVIALAAWAIAAAIMLTVGIYSGPAWLIPVAPALFAAGALLTAWYFMRATRKHTDYSMTYSQYLKARRNA
jgi:heme-degrading monooxygenase HmoA